MRAEDFTDWPGVSQTARQMGVSTAYICRMVRTGRLRILRTRIGWLIDPASIAELQAHRKARYLAGIRSIHLTPEQARA